MMSPLAAALVIGAVLVAPHLAPRTELRPVTAIAMWTTVLGLRAALCAVAALWSVLFLPSTPPFQAISDWCVHAGVPFFAEHFGLSGHALGDVASFTPVAVLLTLTATAGIGAWKALRAAASWLGRNAVGYGPDESVIVGDAQVIVATAGVARPKVIVSAGALIDLDDAELKAGLAHEWGHVRRGHRSLTLTSTALLAASRLLPGGRKAFDELQFHLERDADDYAVRRTGDPLALASAICKTAAGGSGAPAPLMMASLAGANTAERLRLLLQGEAAATSPHRHNFLASAVAAGALVFGVSLLLMLPELAYASAAQAHTSIEQLSDCLS